MGRWDRVERVVDVTALRRAHVLVVGLGSGGSTVALELAKAGVGRFTLIDPDDLEEANLIRHECDDRFLGWNKATAVAELIRHRNPDAEVAVHAADAFDLGGRLEATVRSADLVAACTDAEPPKNLINRLCIASGVPAVYAGVYERGTGGEIIRCTGSPGDACYACVTSVLKESVPVPDTEPPSYGIVEVAGALRSEPGLGLDVRLVALIQAKVCLLTLIDTDGTALPGDVVLFGNEAVEGLFPRPFASAFLRVGSQAGCLVCGSGSRSFSATSVR